MGLSREFYINGATLRAAREALEAHGFQLSAPPLELLAHGVVLCAWHPRRGGYLISASEARLIGHYGPEFLENGRPMGQAAYDSQDWPGYWARRVLESAIARAEVEGAPGYRNNALYRAAFTAGGLLEFLAEDQVRGALEALAERLGLSHQEARSVINSGLKAGQQRPLEPPVQPEKPRRKRGPAW
jgi:hypothetical protein